jgi:hypothetical protein
MRIMKSNFSILRALCLLLLAASLAYGSDPRPILLAPVETDAGQEKQPEKDKKREPDKKLTEPPSTDIFSQSLLPRGETSTAFNPHMMGDQPGSMAVVSGPHGLQTITTTTRTTITIFNEETETTTTKTITKTTTSTRVVSGAAGIAISNPTTGAFKIAENESPMPADRVYFTYNNFSNLLPVTATPGVNSSQVSSVGVGNVATTTTVSTLIPSQRVTANLSREVFGFEKTFLDGYASIEMRVPLLQQQSSTDGFGMNDVGELTIIAKYAFFLDRATGNVLSGGLAVTAPTGPGLVTADGTLHSTLLQPWLGYVWNADRFFVQAFHSVVVPTDSRDVTLLFNDVGVSYWLYRAEPTQFLSSVVPTFEVHVTTPLDHRGALLAPDQVVLTNGVHFGILRNTTLSLGVATPVTGPRLFNVEGFVQLNWRF